MDARELLWTASLALVVATVITTACGATSQEPCTDADLDKVVAAHEARLAEKCVGQGTDCDERRAENARFEAELKTWVRCDKP